MAKKNCFVVVNAVLEFEDEEQAARIGAAIGVAINEVAKKETAVLGSVVLADLRIPGSSEAKRVSSHEVN